MEGNINNGLLLIFIALIGGSPPALMAFLAWRRGLMIQKTADEIHVSTNSTLTELRAELKKAHEKIDGLEALIREHIIKRKKGKDKCYE